MKIYFFEIEEGADVGFEYFTSRRKALREFNRQCVEGMEPGKIFSEDVITLLERQDVEIYELKKKEKRHGI